MRLEDQMMGGPRRGSPWPSAAPALRKLAAQLAHVRAAALGVWSRSNGQRSREASLPWCPTPH